LALKKKTPTEPLSRPVAATIQEKTAPASLTVQPPTIPAKTAPQPLPERVASQPAPAIPVPSVAAQAATSLTATSPAAPPPALPQAAPKPAKILQPVSNNEPKVQHAALRRHLAPALTQLSTTLASDLLADADAR